MHTFTLSTRDLLRWGYVEGRAAEHAMGAHVGPRGRRVRRLAMKDVRITVVYGQHPEVEITADFRPESVGQARFSSDADQTR